MLAPTSAVVLPRPICQATCVALQAICQPMQTFMSAKIGSDLCTVTRGVYAKSYPNSMLGTPYYTGSEPFYPETTETLTFNGSSYTTTCENATRKNTTRAENDAALDVFKKLNPPGCIPVARGEYFQSFLECNFPCKYTWSNLTVASRKLTAWYLA